MRDPELVKISLLVSTVGLAILFFVSLNSQPSQVKISGVDYDTAGTTVIIEGSIVSKKVHEDGHIFIRVSDGTGKILVPLFSSLVEKLPPDKLRCVEAGNKIRVRGRVEEYRGSLEVVPLQEDDIACWSS